MNTNNIIAIVATSLLCIAAVPSVLSFGGYVVTSNNGNNVAARNYHKCWRAQQQDMMCHRRFGLTDGVHLRHNVQLQMAADESTNDGVDNNELRVSKRKRLLNVFRRVFRRRSTELQEDELEEEEESISISITEDASIELTDDNAEEDEILEVEAPSSITEDMAMEGETDDNVDDDIVSSSTTTNTTTPTPISSTRQATASPNTDLSGTWAPIVTPSFKSEYDDYLQNCSQSFMFRKVIVN
eukprot:scaffold10138_cov103-Skeletonema_marinoi.AAC.1